MSLETRRLALQAKLEQILGTTNVYYDPPSNIVMKYPCIVYSYKKQQTFHADNVPYIRFDEYDIILITKSAWPSDVLEGLGSLPYSKLDRTYTADHLHHFLFQVKLSKEGLLV